MSRQESCHASTVKPTGKHRHRKLAWHQETLPEAVWGTRESHNATKQVDMQLSSSAADETDVSSRELSCKSGSPGVEGLLCAGDLAGPSRRRLGRQEVCPEAVLGARRPVLSAQDEAVFGARSPRRPVWRPSWAPGGPSRAPGAPCRGRLGARPVLSARLERQDSSGGRLERQEARLERHEPRAEAVWAPGGPSGRQEARFERQEAHPGPS